MSRTRVDTVCTGGGKHSQGRKTIFCDVLWTTGLTQKYRITENTDNLKQDQAEMGYKLQPGDSNLNPNPPVLK